MTTITNRTLIFDCWVIPAYVSVSVPSGTRLCTIEIETKRMREISRRLFFVVRLVAPLAFGQPADGQERIRVVATTGMIADAARQIGGNLIGVQVLMGPGVDPHAYRQTRTDIAAMAKFHADADAAITFATIETISQYGLIVMNDSRIAGFERDSAVTGYQIRSESGVGTGLVYAGICMLDRRSLDLIDLATTPNFEAELFPKLISEERTQQFRIPKFWCSIDTQKDLERVNTGAGTNPRVALPASQLREILENASVP